MEPEYATKIILKEIIACLPPHLPFALPDVVPTPRGPSRPRALEPADKDMDFQTGTRIATHFSHAVYLYHWSRRCSRS